MMSAAVAPLQTDPTEVIEEWDEKRLSDALEQLKQMHLQVNRTPSNLPREREVDVSAATRASSHDPKHGHAIGVRSSLP